jgi:methionyl-tRNA synthetase
MSKNYFVTTPIYYVNDKPHIGHFYCNLLADTFIRLQKSIGKNVRGLTGTDEHGQKIQRSAENSSILPIEFCNNISNYFRKVNIDFDFTFADNNFDNGKSFIRTTEGRDLKTGNITTESLSNGRHIKFVQEVWQKLFNNGWIYKSKYCGFYAIRDEAFYNENELIDGKAPTGAEVEWREEGSYFFRLSKFQQLLLKFYINNSDVIIPNKKALEIISFLEGRANGSLEDLSISRLKRDTFYWGIPVPQDDSHIIYVWLDALFNYVSALGSDCQIYWDKKYATVNHFIGKEIIRFHAIYWPAFLIALEYKPDDIVHLENQEGYEKIKNIIYDKIFVHGWWTNQGEKISKSLGNIIDPYTEVEWLVKTFSISNETAIDYLKYFCLSNISFGSDADYSRQKLTNTVNGELVNNIGNLIQRILSMLNKYFVKEDFINLDTEYLLPSDLLFYKSSIEKLNEKTNLYIEYCDFFSLLKLINDICTKCNSKIEQMAPWQMIKENKKTETLSHILSILFIIKSFIDLLAAILPNIGSKLKNNIDSVNPIVVCPRLITL